MILDQGPASLYFQLKNIIKSKILSNEFKAQERLPSEAELCAEYTVSRATVRQALLELEKEGLIYRDRGRGTFVTDGVGLKQLALKGTVENLIASGRGTRIKVLEYKEALPSSRLTKIFRLEGTQNVFQLELVRRFRKGPFGYSFIYLPPRLGRIVPRNELTERTEIITFLEKKMNKRVHRASQTINVGLVDEVVAKNLLIKPKSPVLIIEREYYARDGSIMFASLNYFRPDLYKYRIELTRV
jgi:GntR family transcriptional regulator